MGLILRSTLAEGVREYEIVEALLSGLAAKEDILVGRRRTSPHPPVLVKHAPRDREGFATIAERLREEAGEAGAYVHPNLTAILDLIETPEAVSLVLEHVDGVDLATATERLEGHDRGLPAELAAFVCIEMLRALQHLHEARDHAGARTPLIVRDISPANVFITHAGRIKLANRSLISALERRRQRTGAELFSYFAPECIAGEPFSVASDLYGVGVLLFELLSETRCFLADSKEAVLSRIVDLGVPFQSLELRRVPEALVAIVQRATAVLPERRFPSALEMASALAQHLRESQGTAELGPVLLQHLSATGAFANSGCLPGLGRSGMPRETPKLENENDHPKALTALLTDDLVPPPLGVDGTPAATRPRPAFSPPMPLPSPPGRSPSTPSPRDVTTDASREALEASSLASSPFVRPEPPSSEAVTIRPGAPFELAEPGLERLTPRAILDETPPIERASPQASEVAEATIPPSSDPRAYRRPFDLTPVSAPRRGPPLGDETGRLDTRPQEPFVEAEVARAVVVEDSDVTAFARPPSPVLQTRVDVVHEAEVLDEIPLVLVSRDPALPRPHEAAAALQGGEVNAVDRTPLENRKPSEPDETTLRGDAGGRPQGGEVDAIRTRTLILLVLLALVILASIFAFLRNREHAVDAFEKAKEQERVRTLHERKTR